jgi:hypothetical protein
MPWLLRHSPQTLPQSPHNSILCGSMTLNRKNVLLLNHGRTVAQYIFNSEVSMWELNDRKMTD